MRIPPTGIPLEDIERQAVIEALNMSSWTQKDAAELLAISPRVMNYKIKTLKIDLPRSRRPQVAKASERRPLVLSPESVPLRLPTLAGGSCCRAPAVE